MSQKPNSRRWKKVVQIVIGCILALDAILIYVNWSAANSAPQAQQLERINLTTKARQYGADVVRGQSIAEKLPQVAKDCDSFYRQQLLPATTGYSVVIADIGEMSREAGVDTSGVAFKSAPLKDRGLNEVAITAIVQGDYPGVIRLLDAMEHSPHFYVLDSLTLASVAEGTIRLNLTMRTYFRT
jgi:hypothetical protein